LADPFKSRITRLVALGAIVAAAAVAAIARPDAKREQASPSVTVIYVGAEDCAPCRIWRRDRFPAFLKSAEFRRLAYREVTSTTLFDLLSDNHWPDDLRQYRDSLGMAAGVPLWFVVADDKIALTARGLREWGEMAVPKIRSLLH
jgi:hypothetical protein